MNAQLFQNLFKVVIGYALEKLYRYCVKLNEVNKSADVETSFSV